MSRKCFKILICPQQAFVAAAPIGTRFTVSNKMRGNSTLSTDRKKNCLVKSSRKFDCNRSASATNAVKFYDTEGILLNLREEGGKSNYLTVDIYKDSSNARILPGSSFSSRVHQEKMTKVTFKKRRPALLPAKQCSQTFNYANASSATPTTYFSQENVHNFSSVDLPSVTICPRLQECRIMTA